MKRFTSLALCALAGLCLFVLADPGPAQASNTFAVQSLQTGFGAQALVLQSQVNSSFLFVPQTPSLTIVNQQARVGAALNVNVRAGKVKARGGKQKIVIRNRRR